jgi:hypothetical protein
MGPSHKAEKIQRGREQLSELAFYIVTGVGLGPTKLPRNSAEEGSFMPSKLAISFLGMVVGGSAFMFAGLITFLTVSQLDRQIQTTQVQTSPPVVQARFAQLSQ